MAKKLLRDIWSETPIKFGKYKHKKNGKFAYATPSFEKRYDWEIDKGKVKNHPFFRVKLSVVEQGTGNLFFWRSLKDYDFDSELDQNKE